MKKIIALILCCMFLYGCATGTSNINPRMLVYQNFPHRVGVFSFTGSQYAPHATDVFSMGLIEIPYFEEVVERNKIQQVLQELGFQYSGLVDERTITEAGKQLGLDAIFVGNVVTYQEPMWLDTRITIKLVEVKTGAILWGSNTKDNRTVALVLDPSESAEVAAKNALKKLKEDLKKIKKSDSRIKMIIEEEAKIKDDMRI